jgi:hypothetical protein
MRYWEKASHGDLIVYAAHVLLLIPCDGLNPYKMWKNHQPNVPLDYHMDELYAEPSPEVLSKVKMEKTDRSEFRANLKAEKYAKKEQVESTAFDSEEGMA